MSCTKPRLAAAHARGIDQLPGDVTSVFEASLVRQLDTAELSRAFRVAVSGLLNEIQHVDMELAGRLQRPLTLLSDWYAEAPASSAGV